MKYKQAKIIVIKIGSTTLADEKGKLDTSNLRQLAAQISALHQQGKQVVIVSSGAIVTGAERLGILHQAKPHTIPEKQAAAAIGQSLLMKEYDQAFQQFGITVAQVLLTRDAIADRSRYINARNTLFTLLKEKVIPIVNENDTVSVDEIKVGDNDNLSALVASLIGADLLVMLTDVEGFFVKDAETNEPKLLEKITEITPEIEKAAQAALTPFGTGGMETKLQAVRVAIDAGTSVIIAYGRRRDVFEAMAAGKNFGTLFTTKVSKLESRKRWLAHGLPVGGTIIIDHGAAEALRKKGSSLLAVGVKEVKGDFASGETINIQDSSGNEIGRGLANYSCHEVEKIKGVKTADIEKVLGYKVSGEIVHRDNMVLLES